MSQQADLALLELLREEKRRRDEARRFDWATQARPEQLAPEGDWTHWLILAGRGWGKTRTGAETVRRWVEQGYTRIALVGPTAADVRDVMVEGPAGVLNVWPDELRPVYEPSKRRITFHNGATATTFSAEEPDRLRGPQHDAAWCDEMAAWAKPEAMWSNLLMGLRLGTRPRTVITTTPRPIPLVRELLKEPLAHVTRGRTLDNAANLAPGFVNELLKKYEGTRLGRQELDGEVLEDIEGALWNLSQLEALRVEIAPELRRVVIAVDPAATASENSDYTGLAAVGIGVDGHCYVLAAEHMKASPDEWSRRAWTLFDTYKADRLILETNQGGEMGTTILRQARRGQLAPIATVTAKRGKTLRAEPVAHLYELGRVHHVGPAGSFRALEDEMCAFPVAAQNDDVVDALVHAVTALVESQGAVSIGPSRR